MASLFSNLPFDQGDLNLNRVYSGSYDFEMFENANVVYNGVLYVDVYRVYWQEGGSYYVSEFAGPNIVVDGNGVVTGGTVTGYLEYYWAGSQYVEAWGIQGISVPAQDLYSAATTPSVSDDYTLINAALSGADGFYLGSFADVARGLGGADRLFGEGGADFLLGGAGADFLSGGAGADVLRGGRGADIIEGAPGMITYSVDAAWTPSEVARVTINWWVVMVLTPLSVAPDMITYSVGAAPTPSSVTRVTIN